jgi:hypothetical protein
LFFHFSNLWKRGDKGLLTSWKFRKFALDNNEDKLYYFSPENPTKAKGFIELRVKSNWFFQFLFFSSFFSFLIFILLF